MSTPFVVILGIGTVFIGLSIMILLCKLMSLFVLSTESKQQTVEKSETQPTVTPRSSDIKNKQDIIVAISAVVAEELGTGISNIRIHSIKKV